MKHMLTGLLVALLLATQGCAALGGERTRDAQSPTSESTRSEAIAPTASAAGFVSMLRQWNSFDYEPTSGPSQLRAQADIVVDGVVTDVQEGRIIGQPGDGPMFHVVVTVKPNKTYKAPGQDAQPVYVEFNRPDNVPASEFRKALPEGTRVLLFGYEVNETVAGPVSQQFAGRQIGSPIYAADPQGFFVGVQGQAVPALVGPDEMIQGWAGMGTFNEITQALR